MPDSPIVLRLTNTTNAFHFFRHVLNIYNLLISEEDYNILAWNANQTAYNYQQSDFKQG